MTIQPVPLFGLPDAGADPEALESAANVTIAALRELGAIQPQHELDVMIVLELAKSVPHARGIARSQLFTALMLARSRLPEPVVATVEPEALEYEGARAIEYFRAHSAELENITDAEPLD